MFDSLAVALGVKRTEVRGKKGALDDRYMAHSTTAAAHARPRIVSNKTKANYKQMSLGLEEEFVAEALVGTHFFFAITQ